MELFKWLNDIENVYENLISKAQEESFAEIKSVIDEEDKKLEKLLKKKQESVDLILKSYIKEVEDYLKNFEKKDDDEIKRIQSTFYQNNEKKLIELILEKLRYDF